MVYMFVEETHYIDFSRLDYNMMLFLQLGDFERLFDHVVNQLQTEKTAKVRMEFL